MAHSTNYTNTLITVSSDYSFDHAKPAKEGTIGALQLDAINKAPYSMTSDDLLFSTQCQKLGMENNETNRAAFFAKPQACLRASPLVKTLGYGVHHDKNSKIAVFPIESEEYKSLLSDETIVKKPGMRSKRA